jgi:NgoBV restriction endonuclease
MQTGIISATGEIYFELHNIKTIIRDSSIIGNVIQEWLKSFMDKYDIQYRLKTNSQEFPDFLMNATSDEIDLLEVKCFKNSPNFDVANLQAYARSLLSKPYRLNSDYLIIEYIDIHGGIVIKNIWLKKVWEICCASERSPLKTQVKQGFPYNIRPSTFYSKRAKYQPFQTRRDFVLALKSVIDAIPNMNNIQKDWYKKVELLYKEQSKNEL